MKTLSKVLRIASKPAPVSALAALTAFLSPTANADFYVQHWDSHQQQHKVFDIGLDLSYYGTKENYDEFNQLQLPSTLRQYTRVQTDIVGEYGVMPRLTAYARLSWARVSVDAAKTGTAYGLLDQTVGANYRLWEKTDSDLNLAVDLQGQVDFPGYSNKTSADQNTPFLGDGSTDWTAGAFATAVLNRTAKRLVTVTGGAGYTYRSSGFSAAIPWSLSANYQATEGAFGSVGLAGIYSLVTDKSTFAGSSGSSGTAGSFITNAINPSLVTVRGSIGYRVNSELAIALSGSQAIAGQRAPSGLEITLGAHATLGRKSRKHPAEMAPAEYGRANQGFVNYALEAKVTRVNDRLSLIKINKGSQDGVEVGQVFDIFSTKSNALGEAVARARVTSLKSDEAALSIVEYFREVWIEEGFIVKQPVQ